MALEFLRKVMNRSIYLDGVHIQIIFNALGIDEIVGGDHVSWKLEKDLQQN